MKTQELVRLVHRYLDAMTAADTRRASGQEDREEWDRLDDARQQLITAVNSAYVPAAEPLMTAAREFLHAEDSLDRCRSFGTGADQAARHLDQTRRELKGLLDDRELHDQIIQRCMSTVRRLPSKRIVVAVDETKPAEWALNVAARYARDLSANVMLLHVVRPEESIAEDFVTAQRLAILHRRQGLELLDRLHKMLPPDVDASRMLRMGPPAEEIIRAAHDWNADLIVIGTRGRGRVARFVLGSTAEAVIRRAHCPVVTVGHEPTPPLCADEAEWVGVGADMASPESAHAGVGTADR